MLVPGVCAAGTTVTTFAEGGYMPYHYFILIVAIAFGAWVAMKYCPEADVLFGIISVVAFGIATYYSAYISTTDAFATVSYDGSATVTYAQLVSPQPIFQLFFGTCLLLSFIYTVYVLFLRQADATLEKKSIR